MKTPPKVAAVLATYPKWAQATHGALRSSLLDQAQQLDVGAISETLKWGQPSYLTEETGAGTTVRLAWSEKSPDVFKVFVHCQTSLVEEWRQAFGDALVFQGNRAIQLAQGDDLPLEILAQCFASALTYHRD